ncbi:antirestriction protein (plasmid) [Salmonella enterica subsp. enterica serovar Karamoja]|uniref:Antirestriction protein n=1 Tax=Salmonella enterica subsp. enterica serovar Karamoja TaxID=2500153 RepID=A0A3Q9MY40_SALET|nr:antirestriction protein [Salmonella enterica]AZT39621.1 antirestriction protein [Salmonella enterica subsp. enterica serovar Karamoja]AZT44295.1 antirestriction protein [Salmonella enterica subsp. enterica serovar Karamoja]
MQYVTPRAVPDVEETDRLSFMPYMFGTDFMLSELMVYALAQKHLPGSAGSSWHFIRLPEGGGYMMPDNARCHLVITENWFDSTVSADAAGIILTAMALCHRCHTHHDCGNSGLTRLFLIREAQLFRFIESHPERDAIKAALN